MSAKIAIQPLVIKKSNSEKLLHIEYAPLRKALLVLRAISHPVRKKVLSLLASKQQMIVTDIYKELNTEQSVASQHLATLRKAGILQTRREGKFIYYNINRERITAVSKIIEGVAL